MNHESSPTPHMPLQTNEGYNAVAVARPELAHEGILHAAQAMDRLDQDRETAGVLHPKETILAGGSAVEGQQISFTRQSGGNVASFKLTAPAQEHIASLVPANIEQSYITYGDSSSEVMTAEAHVLRVNGLEIKIAKPNTSWRALDGQVTIRPDAQQEAGQLLAQDNQEMAKALDATMRDVFGIENVLAAPDTATEDAYKQARYGWHHKQQDAHELPVQAASLTRAEVFDGYSTMVEQGKAAEYESTYGEIASYHNLTSHADLSKVLKTGLAATTERFQRGNMALGEYSVGDLQTGGADSVFVRSLTETSLANEDPHTRESDVMLVMNPKIMDRTDWYAYTYDHNGATTPDAFAERVSPDELFQELNEKGYENNSTNEQMFRTGISKDAFMGLAVGSEQWRQIVIDNLKNDGVHDVNGVALEDFVHVAKNLSQVIDVAHGRTPREIGLPDYGGLEVDA